MPCYSVDPSETPMKIDIAIPTGFFLLAAPDRF
jgi:hypothetical protein